MRVCGERGVGDASWGNSAGVDLSLFLAYGAVNLFPDVHAHAGALNTAAQIGEVPDKVKRKEKAVSKFFIFLRAI